MYDLLKTVQRSIFTIELFLQVFRQISSKISHCGNALCVFKNS